MAQYVTKLQEEKTQEELSAVILFQTAEGDGGAWWRVTLQTKRKRVFVIYFADVITGCL